MISLFWVLLGTVSSISPEDAVIRPGAPWFDTDGNRMFAGGANMYTEDGVYYLVGEGEKVLAGDISECFNLYSSTDLQNWDFRGCVLKNEDVVAPQPSTPYRIERPKILKCPGTGKYVMWFHCDTPSFSMESVGVLTSDNVTGPYEFASPCFQPDGRKSYDMGTFVDEKGDGRAYLVRSVENKFAGVSRMTEDCLNVTGIISQGPKMEGNAIMRDTKGVLHMAGSHLTGWASNAAQFVTAPTSKVLKGAEWSNNYNPSSSGNTYDSQSSFLFPFQHADGHTTFIWMADRWNTNGPGGIKNMTFIWLPLLPATGGPAPQSPLTLSKCDNSDANQRFGTSGATVTHQASGLCIERPAQSQSSQLVIAACIKGSLAQHWQVDENKRISNGHTDSTCAAFNNDNNVLYQNNPIISWPCSNPPAWNALWTLRSDNNAGDMLEALKQDGSGSGMCASVKAPSWTLPYEAAWSLKHY